NMGINAVAAGLAESLPARAATWRNSQLCHVAARTGRADRNMGINAVAAGLAESRAARAAGLETSASTS
ncbi:hypothetical protein, partial [Clostridium perfringens]